MIKKSSLAKITILSIAIALISVFFFSYAIQSIYPSPEYDDYCAKDNHKLEINTTAECEAIGGRWDAYREDAYRDIALQKIDLPNGYCDRDFTCRTEYEEVKNIYERNVFFANIIIGISVFIIGFFLTMEAVSSGLMGGGVIMTFYGTIRYWGNLSDIWRTFILGISLIILIWLGYKKLND